MKKTVFLFFIVGVFGLFAGALQDAIDQAAPGAKLSLPAGRFKGPVEISKPLIIEGKGKNTVIEGTGSGSVVHIDASHVTLRNLSIRNSGRQRYRLDSAIVVNRAKDVTVEKCTLQDVLFGIILNDTEESTLRGNTIISYREDVADNRGDGIRLWASHHNLITGNHLKNGRDLSLTRSNHNVIEDNEIQYGRYGVLLQMCHAITLRHNRITANDVGVLCRGSNHVHIEDNTIVKTFLATGTGVMLIGGKELYVQHNTVMKHAQAFYIDATAKNRKMKRFIEHNRIALNNEAFHFHADIANNTIRCNTVDGNLFDVVKDIRSAPIMHNVIALNYWDQYQGFDRDHDGIGDTPYQVLLYADRLWQFAPHLKFFYGTPLLSVVNFIEKVAPFSAPVLLLEDREPKREPY